MSSDMLFYSARALPITSSACQSAGTWLPLPHGWQSLAPVDLFQEIGTPGSAGGPKELTARKKVDKKKAPH